MFDHIGITVKDFNSAKAFYVKVLKPLGMKELYGQDGDFCGFGKDRPIFWITTPESKQSVSGSAHVAFIGTSKEQVESFYTLALEAGGKDNGKPEYQTEYAANYYAAYVHDLDGNNIEIVFRDPHVAA